jgi:hypothetical protein
MNELAETLAAQPRTPMGEALYDRFTGLAAARAHLGRELARLRARRVCIVPPIGIVAKNAWAVRRACDELGVRVVERAEDAEALVVGTLSPGPMLDTAAALRGSAEVGGPPVLTPWMPIAGFAGSGFVSPGEQRSDVLTESAAR